MKKYLLLSFLLVFSFLKTQGQKHGHVPGDIIVQMKPGGNVEHLARAFQIFGGQQTGIEIKKNLSPSLRVWLLSFDFSKTDEKRLLQEIKKQPGVQAAQFNRLIEMRNTVPNDPNFTNQWQWKNTGQNGGTPDADVDADEAWDITTGGQTTTGKEIVVCVIEEGANRNHPDLQGNLWFNVEEIPNNNQDDDGNGYVDDYNGWNPLTNNDIIPTDNHGTFVSGMIGAKGNNGIQVSGINWDVKIMHVVIGSLTESSVMEAYTYPLVMRRRFNESGGNEGALVVATNASWGLDGADPNDFPLWCAFYDSLGQAGILSCGATANINWNIDTNGDMPTACASEFLISVTSSNRNDQRAAAGFGLTTIDVAAPGEDVVNVQPPGTWSGTSFASPLAAGLVALLYAAPCPYLGMQAIDDPAGAARLVRDAIFNGVDKKPGLLNELKYGGRVNAFKSLQILLENCGPCPKPFGIALGQVLDTTALISWKSTDSTVWTQLLWRIGGDTIWTEVDSVVSPFLFSPLFACSNYELQLEDVCADTVSGFTDLIAFKTDGCCEPPSTLAITGLSDTGFTATWNKVLAAQAYRLKLIAPAGFETIEGLTDTVFIFENLSPCTFYGIQVQTVCDTGLTDFGEMKEFRTLGCGACLDLNYCSAKAVDATQEWISNVSIGALDNTSGSDVGYGDFTGLDNQLTTYTAYPLSLSPGFAGGVFSEWFRVWMDFNQDGDFFDAGESVFNAAEAATTTVTGTVIIPGAALPGVTRMRVAMRWNNTPGPCDLNFNFGEVEDYCVTIVEGTPPLCLAPDSLGVSNVGHGGATLSWQNRADAITYSLRYKKATASSWTVVQANVATHVLQNLAACTDYEVQAGSNCIGVESEWSESTAFTTLCYPPCDEVPSGLDTGAVTHASTVLKWNAVPTAIGYSVRYKKASATNWINFSTAQTSHELLGLENCTGYQFSIKALCEGNLSSAYAGVFDFSTQCASAVQEAKPISAFEVSPNPFANFLRVGFTLGKTGEAKLELFDARGQRLLSNSAFFTAGENAWLLPSSAKGFHELPKGIYLIKLTTGEGFVVRKILKE